MLLPLSLPFFSWVWGEAVNNGHFFYPEKPIVASAAALATISQKRKRRENVCLPAL